MPQVRTVSLLPLLTRNALLAVADQRIMLLPLRLPLLLLVVALGHTPLLCPAGCLMSRWLFNQLGTIKHGCPMEAVMSKLIFRSKCILGCVFPNLIFH